MVLMLIYSIRHPGAVHIITAMNRYRFPRVVTSFWIFIHISVSCLCFSALQSLADFGLGSVLPVTVLRCSRRLDLVEQALDARHLGGHEIPLLLTGQQGLVNFFRYRPLPLLPIGWRIVQILCQHRRKTTSIAQASSQSTFINEPLYST
jgi:hypothetical protein